MNKNIKQLIKYPLSNLDIYNFFNNKVNIYSYKELSNYNDLEDLFNNYNKVFILYEFYENYGHWCVLCKNINNIYFFDPYGIFPDKELKFSDYGFRKDNNMLVPHLTYLLLKSNKNIHFNNHKFQSFSTGISTCGRWCIIFCILFNNFSIDEIYSYFKNKKINMDEYVTKLTFFI